VTAQVIPMRGVPKGKPCCSGTDRNRTTEECGRTDTRLYAGGWRCPAHPVPSTASLRAHDLFAVPTSPKEAA
jgi:hypothetical protein